MPAYRRDGTDVERRGDASPACSERSGYRFTNLKVSGMGESAVEQTVEDL